MGNRYRGERNQRGHCDSGPLFVFLRRSAMFPEASMHGVEIVAVPRAGRVCAGLLGMNGAGRIGGEQRGERREGRRHGATKGGKTKKGITDKH